MNFIYINTNCLNRIIYIMSDISGLSPFDLALIKKHETASYKLTCINDSRLIFKCSGTTKSVRRECCDKFAGHYTVFYGDNFVSDFYANDEFIRTCKYMKRRDGIINIIPINYYR